MKFFRLSAALAALVAAGAFGGGPREHGDGTPAGGGRSVSDVMNDALDGIQGGLRNALGIGNGPQPTATKIGAVRDNATFEGVGAVGGDGGLGGDANGGIGGGVGSTGDPSGSDIGF